MQTLIPFLLLSLTVSFVGTGGSRAEDLWQKAVHLLFGDPFFRQPEVQDLLLGDTLEKQRRIFQEAYKYYQIGQHGRARVFFLRAMDVYPELSDYHLYFLGKTESACKNFHNARWYFSQLHKQHPSSVWIQAATLEMGKIAYRQNDFDRAVALLQPIQDAKTDVSHEASLYVSRSRLAKGDPQAAFEVLKKLRSQPTAPRLRREIKDDIQKLRSEYPSAFQLSSDSSMLEEANFLIKEREFQGAEELLKDLLLRPSSDSGSLGALSALARSYQVQRRRDDEISVLRQILADPNASVHAVKATYRLAQIRWNLDENSEARRLLLTLTSQSPDHPLVGDMLYMLGRIHQEAKEYRKALRFYRDIPARFPKSRFRDEVWWRVGWVLFVQGKHRAAEREFREALSRGIKGSFRESSMYWLGRTLEKNRKKREAKRVYLQIAKAGGDSYYSGLAEKRLRALKALPQEPTSSRAPSSYELQEDSLPQTVLFHLRRSRELAESKMFQFAVNELDAIRAETSLSPGVGLLILREYERNHVPGKTIRVAWEVLRSQPSQETEALVERFVYPLEFFDLISETASEQGVDPYLVAALVRQESAFDPAATSTANAQGLMQILPPTGLQFSPADQHAELRKHGFYEPALNLKVGTTYLGELIQKYRGDLSRALAAYNAGEGAVAKWEEIAPGAPPEVFVENITYRETRHYVKLILRNYRAYKRLYQGAKP